jgi:hypothetical protein
MESALRGIIFGMLGHGCKRPLGEALLATRLDIISSGFQSPEGRREDSPSSYREEIRRFLKRHRLAFGERFLWE